VIPVTPIGDKLFVLPVETTKIGSIIVGKVPPPVEGIVLAVGPGAHTRKGVFVTPDVQVGDRVLFSQFAGQDVTLSDRDLKVLAECDVQAVLGAGVKVGGLNELTL